MITNAFEKSCIWEYYGKRSTAPKEQPLNPPQYLQKYLGTLWKVEYPDMYRSELCNKHHGSPSIHVSYLNIITKMFTSYKDTYLLHFAI